MTSIRKSAPLRDIGESRAALRQLPEQERIALFLICGVVAVLAIAEAASALLSGPRLMPAWFVGIAVIAGYAWYHLRAVRRLTRLVEEDAASQRLVQAELAGLAVNGARVFSNVPGGRRPIGLVLLSPHGAYVCDVKIATAGRTGPLKVILEAERFRADGVTISPSPTRWIAEDVQSLQQLLRIGRNDDVVVRPLIVIVGTPAVQVERQKGAPDVGVVAARALDQYLKSQPEQLSVTELTMHAVRLAATIREQAAVARQSSAA